MSLLRSPLVAYVPTAREKKDRSGSRKKRFEGAGPYARPTNKTSPSGGNIFGFYVTVQAPDPIGEKRVWISKPPIKLERLRKFLNRKFGKNITHENYEIVRAPNTALGWDWAVVINDDWDIDQPMTLTFTPKQMSALEDSSSEDEEEQERRQRQRRRRSTVNRRKNKNRDRR